jgi:helix-turn-helix protein
MPIESCRLGRDEIPSRALYSPRETEQLLGISHATLYRLVAARRLDARKIDGKTVITAPSIEAFLASLPKADVGEAA